jgi:hypothetical protein
VDLEVLRKREGHEDEHDGHDDEELDEGEAGFGEICGGELTAKSRAVRIHGSSGSFAGLSPCNIFNQTLSAGAFAGQTFADLVGAMSSNAVAKREPGAKARFFRSPRMSGLKPEPISEATANANTVVFSFEKIESE